MAKKKHEKKLSKSEQEIQETEKTLEAFEQSLTKTELYIEENKKSISIILTAIIVLFAGYYAYQAFVVKPKMTEAQDNMFTAESYFKNGNWEMALNGDGQDLGFLDVASDYSGTPAGNLANAYAGICLAKQGNFAEAIDYLEAYSGDSKVVLPMVKSALADCYVQTQDMAAAKGALSTAIASTENKFLKSNLLKKAALLAEKEGDVSSAKDYYKQILSIDKKSQDGRFAEKMLAKHGEF
ncbi:MAG: hypothetical protein N4A45_00500 [Flavobacteriales bacterium]|jgi:tetratricopeptide (TPR) repeat protein|nr:hypothetical protein [Flavobacteriales bacterium]